MEIQIVKKEFMHREICSMCFLASFGMALRIPFYKKGINREPIKEYFREELWNLIDRYSSRQVEDKEHIELIVTIKNEVNNKFSEQLSREGITFGRAQKLINLYLKYMWVCGYVKEPPHCPIDSQVIGKLGQEFNGVGMISMKRKNYDRIIEAIREMAGGQSIAEWELTFFNKISKR